MGVRSLRNLQNLIATHPLTRQSQLGAWRRFASWQLASRLHGTMNVEWIGGQRLIVRRGMTGATGNIYVGLHEFADMMVPLHFLREGDLFFDIGANIGTYTVLASGVCRATTWSFEPDPRTAEHLRKNVVANDLEGLVTIHQVALGPDAGHVAFTLGLDTTNRVLLETNGAGPATQQVEQQRLDDVARDAAPVMAKVDVEGYEDHVLRGATEMLSRPHLKVVEIETLTPWISDTLGKAGFQRCYYDPFSRKLTASPNDLPANNSLFVRDREFVAERLASAPPVRVLGRSI
jgi:FkbM family methyltransferase